MTDRQAGAAATRTRLVAAGLALAEEHTLAELSVNRIVAAAGVAKGTFFHHFSDRAAYLVAIHQAFHDEAFAAVAAATDGVPPGRTRLLRGADAYLDFCRDHRGVRALLLDARSEREMHAAIARRNLQVVERVAPDLSALGLPEPEVAARLWLSLVVEAALVELADPTRARAVRAAVAQFLPPADLA